jgi:hypothetical protein
MHNFVVMSYLMRVIVLVIPTPFLEKWLSYDFANEELATPSIPAPFKQDDFRSNPSGRVASLAVQVT